MKVICDCIYPEQTFTCEWCFAELRSCMRSFPVSAAGESESEASALTHTASASAPAPVHVCWQSAERRGQRGSVDVASDGLDVRVNGITTPCRVDAAGGNMRPQSSPTAPLLLVALLMLPALLGATSFPSNINIGEWAGGYGLTKTNPPWTASSVWVGTFSQLFSGVRCSCTVLLSEIYS